YQGRVEANLGQIVSLPFDFDLTDYLGVTKDELQTWAQADIDACIDRQRQDVEEIFGHLNLPIHRLDYSGYGLAAHVVLPPHRREVIPELRKLHKAIVARINTLSRPPMADPQVCDAGTRIMRLPGSQNLKGEIPRLARTIYRVEGTVTEEQLRHAAGETAAPPQRAIPKTGTAFDAETERAIVRAIAPHWSEGKRHALALAVAGLFAKAGVPEEQTHRIVEDLEGTDESWDRARAVHTSYERVRSGLDVKGFYALREYLPPDLASWLTQRADAVRQTTRPVLLLGSETVEQKDRRIAASFTPAPESSYFGWFGAYRDLMAPTSEAPDQFHLGASLVLAGAMIGRRVHTRYANDPLYANLFAVLIGRTGTSRKDTAIKRATILPQLCPPNRFVNPAFDISRDVSSAEGLVAILKDKPNTLLYLTELSGLLKNARRKGTTTILDRLIEAWDTPETLQNLNKQTPQTAIKPYLSIVAATQPGRIASEMTAEDIASGFANRWLYIVGEGKAPMARPAVRDDFEAGELYLDINDAIRSYPEGFALPWDGDADAVWDDWYYD
ncbi:MAG TPA: hypothetical protein VH482_14665, partial [Thermomicrobiales bacterium]